MNIKIVSKDLVATDAIKYYIGKKSERLVKYFGEDFDVTATIKTEGGLQVAEMEVKTPTDRFRATTEHKDLYASIDKDLDILEGQIRKMKTKKDQQNMTESIRLKEMVQTEAHVVEGEIIKTIYYDIKPLSPEDAIRAVAMLKTVMAGEEVKVAERKWNPNVKLNNVEMIEKAYGMKIELEDNEQVLPKSKKRAEIYEVEA